MVSQMQNYAFTRPPRTLWSGTNECWELDALRPDVIGALIQEEVTAYCDIPRLEQARQREKEARSLLLAVADDWDQIRQQYGS